MCKTPRAAVAALAFACAACGTPAWQAVVNTVLTAVDNGQALATIQAAVAAIFPQYASDANTIAAIVQAAINYLVSIGDIPTPAARPYLDELKVKLDAAKAAGWAPSPKVERICDGFARHDTKSIAVLNAVRGGVL